MNKYNRVDLYRKRSESFARRAVALLEQAHFETEYNQEVEEFHDGLVETGCGAYCAAEEALDFSASLADEYMLLADGLYSAVLTAFFHLWERDVKDLCRRLLRYYPVAMGDHQVTEQNLDNYKYDKIKALLVFWGAKESTFEKINLLRLVVNTVKHSTGPSAAELLATGSPYYKKLTLLCNLRGGDLNQNTHPDTLTVDDVRYFGTEVAAFWHELSTAVTI